MSLPALDVRQRPDHRSELRSQLLLGETVRTLGASRDRQWWRIENDADGYRGWVRTWGLVPASAARAERWRRRARARVVRPYAAAVVAPESDAMVSPLLLNNRLIPLLSRGRFRRVELPDGRRGWVSRADLDSGRGRRVSLGERLRSLIGIPYLWGGRTALGFDCSGFTQQVLLEQGIRLPRDSRHQFRAALPLPRGEEPRPGDLLFFGPAKGVATHVGLALGGGYFAHARGVVRVSSIDHGNPLCDREIMHQILGFRRPDSERGGAGIRGNRSREST